MTIVQALILAVVEGLTEFLPVSSTAHMKFTNPMIGVTSTPFSDMFEIVIQLAAILAVVVVYYKKFFDFSRFSFYIKLIIALIPALVFGVLLKKHIDAALGNLYFMAGVMIGGGILFLFVDKLFTAPRIDDEQQVSNRNAFVIGCFQVLSILLPGFSRSAATIIGGESQKLTRKAAAEFSFFLAVPTMLAASVKSFWDVHKEHPDVLGGGNATLLGLSCLVTFFVAIVVIRLFIGFLKKYGFKPWGYYRIVVGLLMLFLLWRGMI
ncbi:undecaprenyl-diphosphate phosphatase [Puia dinghuensis]|uniref:Undecaprenyl-diphosphatase n=1 Tax=Puia dinghuensis TaxID=1792502 RepID=A0A8J2XTY9_9BACT|nr:undecaprenyl-diphosphate phosphatase [Puia dinghuensis]GGB06972.1 undecaprenyl-diphosphatase [Puia dinghuensis]